MIALWVVCGLLLVVVVWALFSPVSIRFSTAQHRYRLSMYPLQVCFLTDPWRIVVRVWGWEKGFPILPATARKSSAPKKTSGSRKPIPYRKLWALLRTFHVKRLLIRVDTGDYALNGPLYPLVWWLSRWAGPACHFEMNFQGEWLLEGEIENRVVRMLPALWK
jgi:hypothetical protein